jgi:hypothetical protein
MFRLVTVVPSCRGKLYDTPPDSVVSGECQEGPERCTLWREVSRKGSSDAPR